VATDDLRVLQRVAHPQVPGRLDSDDRRSRRDGDEPHVARRESCSTTPATKLSSSSSEPSLT
jgi:hypothetical protein